MKYSIRFSYVLNFFCILILNVAISTAQNPSINTTSPADGETNVFLDVAVTADLVLPNNAGVDQFTLSSTTVFLYPTTNPGNPVPAVLNTTGGTDAIVLQPSENLQANTSYTFEVTNGLLDESGAAFIPFTMSFTTGTQTSVNPISGVEFTKSTVATGAQYTTVTVGPDNKLYGLVNNGSIHRWDMNPDGTLSNQEVINSLQSAEGGNRLAICLVFDPTATAGNLIAWVTHTTFGFGGMADWAGKITRLSGANLEIVQDYVINLPRSAKDHVTNGAVFGPDGALYVLQGSNSAMGAPDGAWSNRDERLLSACLMRVELSAIASPPLDVKTEDGGTYDPYSPGAPVTLWGTGIRNAYDVVYHSNGFFYIPTNGSAAGGNTPASVPGTIRPDGIPYSGPAVPALSGVSTQPDLLFKVPGSGSFYKYYGHPNPKRGEYVLNGGNPTSDPDAAQVSEYPVGTNPDIAYEGFAYNFENNKSPNGVIEYTSNTFGGGLAGKILVVRYSGGDDIIVLTPNASGQIADSNTGIPGMTGFNNPLDLCENPANGHIYVSEYGGNKITLLTPVTSDPQISSVQNEVIFSGFVNPPGTLADDIQELGIENVGGTDLSISGISFAGADASAFSLNPAVSFPLAISPAASSTISIEFDPQATGALEASIEITCNDPLNPIFSIPLYGLASQQFEGSNEPPMEDILEVLGYQVDPGWTGLTSSTSTFPLGDEVIEPLFKKAAVGNIEMIPVGRYSPAWQLPYGWYEENGASAAPALQQVAILESGQGGTTNPDPEHQTLFPEIATGSVIFDPGNLTFGLYTTSPSHTAYTEDALNALLHPSNVAHAVRIYPLSDRNGVPVQNAYLLGFEEASNGDYNDYMFVLKNVVPATSAPLAGTRINVNGPQYTTGTGVVFDADNPALVTGTTTTGSKSFDVLGTTDDPLYLDYRFGEDFAYNIPVTNGTYSVVLHFCEIYFGAPGGTGTGSPGDRTFNVDIEGGQEQLNNYDIIQDVGSATAVSKTFQGIQVTDGNMTITFTAIENNAIIQAIEVLQDEFANTPPLVNISTPVEAAVFTEGDAISFAGTANDQEDGDLTAELEWSSDLDGNIGSGGTFDNSTLSVGTHLVTASVTDGNGSVGSESVSIVISAAATSDIIYRETFWNEDEANDIPVSDRGWACYESGGVLTPASQNAASKAIGNPAGLQNVNAADADPTPADGRGFAAAFNSDPQYFIFTTEYIFDPASAPIEQITWYQGHNNGSAESRVAVQVDGQWYVSGEVFTNTGVGSGDNFGPQSEQKSFTWTTSNWQLLDFVPGSSLGIGSPQGGALPAGQITGFGLYTENATGFTARFDTYTIEGTGSGGGNNGPVVVSPIPDQSATEGLPFSYTVPAGTFSDPDAGDMLTLSATSNGGVLPSWLQFDALTGEFTGTPGSGDIGLLPVEVTATDLSNASVSDAFEIDVQPAPEPLVRLVFVDPVLDVIHIKNFGTLAEDISGYRLCSELNCIPDLNGETILNGTLNLVPGATVEIELVSLSLTDASADLALYLPTGEFTDPNAMADFVQWGTSGNGREAEADAAGLWTAGSFISDPPAFTYTGDGSQSGVDFWQGEICSPISLVGCATVPIDISSGYCLEWDGDEGGVHDGNGTGTGFTMIADHSENLDPAVPAFPDVNGYEPSLLDVNVTEGTCSITATKGIFFRTAAANGNSQVNGLGVAFDPNLSQAFTIETALTNLPAPGTSSFQQAGIWFGLGEADYVKLNVVATSTSAYKVQLLYEKADVDDSESNSANNIVNGGDDIVLRLELDPVALTATGFFSLDGGSSFQQAGAASLALDANVFAGILLPDGSGPFSFGGIHATIRNGAVPLEYTFDRFCINEQPAPETADLEGTIQIQPGITPPVSLVVRLYQSGVQVGNDYTATTDGSGVFNLGDLPLGTFDIWIKNSRTLATQETVTLVAGANAHAFGILPGGDFTDDNNVNLNDFTGLAIHYGKLSTDPSWNAQADFNFDNTVNLNDFTILASTFGSSGPDGSLVGSSDPVIGMRSPELPLDLWVTFDQLNAAPGDALTAKIWMDTRGQDISGVSIGLGIDAELLKPDGVAISPDLPFVLKAPEMHDGVISFEAGSLSHPLNGIFEIGEILFHAGHPGEAELQFLKSTKVSWSGMDYELNLMDNQVRIEPEPVYVVPVVRVFPVPTEHVIYVDWEGIDVQTRTVYTVYDFEGRVVSKLSFIEGQKHMLDLSLVAEGPYIVRMERAGYRLQKRIVVAR